jgi:hypothetical protein
VLLTGPKDDAEVGYYTPSSAEFSGFVADPTHSARDFFVSMWTPRGWQHRFSADQAGRVSPADLFVQPAQAFGSGGKTLLAVGEWDRDESSRRFDLKLPAIFASIGVHTPPFGTTPTPRSVQVGDLSVATIQFQVNWVSHRSRGTCYVYLPDIYGDRLDRSDAFVAGSGSVQLLGKHGGAVDSIRSVPPPSDSRGPYWRCPLKGPDRQRVGCGGVAVFENRGAESDLGFLTFVAGAVVAVAGAVVVDRLLKFRRPPGTV